MWTLTSNQLTSVDAVRQRDRGAHHERHHGGVRSWPHEPVTRVGPTHHNTNHAMVVNGPEMEVRAVAKRQVTGGVR
jgi:hypothetical protein